MTARSTPPLPGNLEFRSTRIDLACDKVGSIHSLTVDAQGILYGTDMGRHRVVAIHPSGTLLWAFGAMGAGPGRLWNPRGISLGRLFIGARQVSCLGVADSWNHRVVFVSLEGTLLALWDRANGKPFEEISDVRFFSRDAVEPGCGVGCWAILDKGNHRLCVIDEAGVLRYQTGRGLPPHLADRWTPGAWPPDMQMDSSPAGQPAMDFLYFPTRILGSTLDSLYIWEPCAQRLKLLKAGHLVPVLVRESDGCQWMGADALGFYAWSEEQRRFLFMDATGNLVATLPAAGVPLHSDGPSRECWVQNETSLVHNRWDPPGETFTPRRAVDELLVRAANKKLRQLDSQQTAHAVADLMECFHDLQTLGFELLEVREPQRYLHLDAVTLKSRLSECRQRFALGKRRLLESLRHLNTGRLWYMLAGLEDDALPREPAAVSAAAGLRQAFSGLSDAFRQLIRRLDEVHLHCLPITAVPEQALEEARSLSLELQREMSGVADWIFGLRGFAGGRTPWPACCGLVPTAFRPGRASPTFMIPPAKTRPPRSSPFREAGILRIPDGGIDGPVSPFCLAGKAPGVLVASLSGRGQVVALDLDGRELFRISGGEGVFLSPAGVALDGRDRLWVGDTRGRRIYAYRLDDLARPALALATGAQSIPAGLCALNDGSLLVADAGTHRIHRVKADGELETLPFRAGIDLGELLHPVALACDDRESGGEFWVVEKRNHRLQKLDVEGRRLGWIGGCGLEPGSLLYPRSAAVLHDGAVAIVEDHPNPRLVALDPDGSELWESGLDYRPGAILSFAGHLFVSEFDGGAIRVYARA